MNIHANLLYTTYKIAAVFYAAHGPPKRRYGTGFALRVDDLLMIGTCRHVIDPWFGPDGADFYGFKLQELEVRGKNLDAQAEPTIDIVTEATAFKAFWPDDGVTDVAVMAQFATRNGQNVKFHPLGLNLIPTAAEMDDLSVGEPVAAIGYVDLHDDLDLRPLLRSGRISSVRPRSSPS